MALRGFDSASMSPRTPKSYLPDIQSQIEVLFGERNRDVVQGCARLCAQFAQAAREDERNIILQQLQLQDGHRHREVHLQASAVTASPSLSWSRGFYDADKLKGTATSSTTTFHERGEKTGHSDLEIAEILRDAFRIKEKVQEALRSSTKDLIEEASVAPEKPKRRTNLQSLVRLTNLLWQDKLLDDNDSKHRRRATIATIEVPNLQENDSPQHAAMSSMNRSRTWAAKEEVYPTEPVAVAEQSHSPTKYTILSPLKAAPQSGLKTPEPRSPSIRGIVGSLSPQQRRELHEDLSKELAALTEELRKAQIIHSD